MELVPPASADLDRWRPPTTTGGTRDPMASPTAEAVWNGVVWGRLGRGDHAWAWWDGVEDPRLHPWIAAERGRLLREVGLHAAARAVEEPALCEAHDVVDVVLLRLSLAADAVGLGEPAAARRALGTAGSLLRELPEQLRVRRLRLLRRWIEVELELLDGEQPDADGLPLRGTDGPQYPSDHDAGTDFHRAKGLLFAGIVRQDPGLLGWAAELAPPALLWAVELARFDAGDEHAADRASSARRAVVPPPGHDVAVAATPTAVRLRGLGLRPRRD